jgi:hypothetical protein
MSTHAQMTTIATYRIALLNNPPLAEPGHGHSAEKGHSTKRARRPKGAVSKRHGVNGPTASEHSPPVKRAYVTQSNS